MNAPVEAPQIEFDPTEILGRMMQRHVATLEQLKTPWHMTSEKTQQKHIAEARTDFTTLICDFHRIIATHTRAAIEATLERVTIDDGIKAVLTLAKTAEGRHALADATGGTVLIQLVDSRKFLTGSEKVKPQADQTQLPLDAQVAERLAGAPEPEIHDKPLSPAYEIRPFDGGYMIYHDEMPIAGARKFETSDEAEKHLREHLNIPDRVKRIEKDIAAAPEVLHYEPGYDGMKASELRTLYKERGGKPFPVGTTKEAMIAALRELDAKPASTLPDSFPFPPGVPVLVLADVEKAFRDAGFAQAKAEGDLDAGLAALCTQYPKDWVEEFYSEVSLAYVTGFEEAQD